MVKSECLNENETEHQKVSDLAVVIVSWNVEPLLRRCLHAIFAQYTKVNNYLSNRWHIIVVDGASTDGSPEMVRDAFPHVQLITNDENVGFTRGNNQGLRALGFQDGVIDAASHRQEDSGLAARAQVISRQPRYVLLLNPDTEVAAGAIPDMMAYLDEHADVGLIGPKLIYPDGSIQSSRRRFPSLLTAFFESTLLQQWWPKNPIAKSYYMSDLPESMTHEVDWVVGACMMVRGEAIESAGLFDENFFMYSEEMDWCRRIKNAGWKVIYLPEAEVLHHEGKSSEQVVPARHIHFQRSKIHYFRKYHGNLTSTVLRFFLLSTYIYQLLEEACKWLLGHKRSLRQERISAYLTVIRSGL